MLESEKAKSVRENLNLKKKEEQTKEVRAEQILGFHFQQVKNRKSKTKLWFVKWKQKKRELSGKKKGGLPTLPEAAVELK